MNKEVPEQCKRDKKETYGHSNHGNIQTTASDPRVYTTIWHHNLLVFATHTGIQLTGMPLYL